MRLVEKKCPNCGGQLKFSYEDKETKCEFCGTSFEIERDNKIADDNEERFNADNYALTEEAKKAAGAILGTFAVAQIIPIIFFAVIFIFIVSIGIFAVKHNNSDSRPESRIVQNKGDDDVEETIEDLKKTRKEMLQEEGYIFSFDDLSENNLTVIHDNSKSILAKEINRYNAFLYGHGDWSYVGMYLLTNDAGNYLYDVFSINFKINGKATAYYSAIKYDNVRVKDGKLVFNMNGFPVGTLNSTSGSKAKDTFGFSSPKDLYNKVIRGESAKSEVLVTGDVYNE